MTKEYKSFLLREKQKALEEKNYRWAREMNIALCQEFCDELCRCICETDVSDPMWRELEQTVEYAYNKYLLVDCQYKFLKKLIDGKRKAREFLERISKV